MPVGAKKNWKKLAVRINKKGGVSLEMSQAGGTVLSSQIPGFEMVKDSGIDEAQLIPVNVDSEDPEVAAAQAFKVLAKILQEAREKKRK